MRTFLREAAVFALFVILTIFMTWPLVLRPATTVSDLGDPLLTSWILDWTSHALTHDPLNLFNAPILYPTLMPLALSEHFVGEALLILPFHLAGVHPVTVFNIAMILGFALSGYGAFVLARMFTPSYPAAIAAGAFYAFAPFKFDHLAHLQVVSSGWLALILAALVAWWRKPTWQRAALLGGAFVMNALSNVYYMLFAAAALGVALLFLLLAGQKRELRAWLRLGAAMVLAALVLLPFLLPYRIVSKEYGMKRLREEVQSNSGEWSDWLRASPRSRWYGALVPTERHRHERDAFPGLLPIVLAVAAIVLAPRVTPRGEGTASTSPPRWLRAVDVLIVLVFLAVLLGAMAEPRFLLRWDDRTLIAIRGVDMSMMALLVLIAVRLSVRLPAAIDERRTLRDSIRDSRFDAGLWVALLWIFAGVLGTLGLNGFFHAFLYERLEPYQSMRAPGRWAAVAYVGMVPWVALGATLLITRRAGAWRRAFAAGVVVLMLVDMLPSIQWEQALTTTPPVYRWLNKTRPEPVVEWPFDIWLEFRYLLGATQHRLQLMNGTSGWEPPVHWYMREAWNERDFARSLAVAEKNGGRVLVVHAHWLGEYEPQKVVAALRAAIASGRLQYLRRFDHGVEGDFVFAITRNFPDWPRLRAPDTPDGAGHLPAEQLARFLAMQPTWSGAPIGRLETAPASATGPLHLEGWAFSSNGIKQINVLVDKNRHRFEARRVPRPELSRQYHWYYEDHPGFVIDLPKRPRGVPRKTDIQIEIVDGAGRRTLLEDHLMYWD